MKKFYYIITKKDKLASNWQQFSRSQNKRYYLQKICIRRNGRPEKVKYDGKFINDITPYLQEKGLYYIRVDVEYKNVKSK